MDEQNRAGPIPVRELMGHLSDTAAEPVAEATRPGADTGQQEAEDVFVLVDDVRWTVREAGSSAWGTDVEGRPAVAAIHFFPPDADRPQREALLPRGRLGSLHPAELRALWEAATEVPPEGAAPARAGGGRARGRRSSGPRRRESGGGKPGREQRRPPGKGRH